MIELVAKYVRHSAYYPDSEAFSDYYFSHPDYPSLYAITDTLHFFGIENIAAKVDPDKLNDLPDRFLALYDTPKGDQFVYVTGHQQDTISFTDAANKTHAATKSQFITNWKAVVVAIEANANNTQKPSPTANKRWLTIVTALAALWLFTQYATGFSPLALCYGLLSFTGAALSILLMQEHFGLGNTLTAKICGASPGGTSGCGTVIQSQGAMVYKQVTLSDVSLVFFTTLSLLSIFPITGFSYFTVVSALSVPVILYALYYQYYIIKQWCTLCLGIAAILSGIGTVTLLAATASISAIFSATLCFAGVLALTASTWLVVKPIITKYFALQLADRENKRFKRKPDTFNALLNHTKTIDTAALNNLFKIELGNPEALNEIGLFLSPSCVHCHTAFKDALALLEKSNNLVKLAVYFNVNIENSQNPYIPVVEIILQTHRNKGNAIDLLRHWHITQPETDAFISKYSTPISAETRHILSAQFNWCAANDFNYAPVKLFNKKLMPESYSIGDLLYLIREQEEA